MYKKQGTEKRLLNSAGCITLWNTKGWILRCKPYKVVYIFMCSKKKSHLSTYYIDFMGKKTHYWVVIIVIIYDRRNRRENQSYLWVDFSVLYIRLLKRNREWRTFYLSLYFSAAPLLKFSMASVAQCSSDRRLSSDHIFCLFWFNVIRKTWVPEFIFADMIQSVIRPLNSSHPLLPVTRLF